MPTARITKRARLLTAAQFDAAFKRGKRLQSGAFTMIVAANDLGFPRLGFALSKRNAPLSVQRNRLRRMFREQFRQQQSALDAVDVVLMLKTRAPTAPDAMRSEVDQAWHQLFSRCKI